MSYSISMQDILAEICKNICDEYSLDDEGFFCEDILFEDLEETIRVSILRVLETPTLDDTLDDETEGDN